MTRSCRWCGDPKAVHNGRVPAATLARFTRPVTRVVQGRLQTIDESTVKWTPTACSNPLCEGCRRYES